MYNFQTKEGTRYKTNFSPIEISNLILFDGFDEEGNRIVIAEDEVDYKTFYYTRYYTRY